MTGSSLPSDSTSSRPLLLTMKGHPGTGKSSLARLIAVRLHAALIDKDHARDCFQALALQVPQVDWNALSYDVMFTVASEQLMLGLSVVVDCPLAHLHLYERAQQLAQQANAVLVVVEAYCSDETVWRARLEERGQEIQGSSQAHRPCTWQQLQQILDRYQGCWNWSRDGSVHVDHHFQVDTSQVSCSEAAHQLLEYLATLQM